MFLNIQIDLLILKTYYGQFTLTTKKSLHIIFNISSIYDYEDNILQLCSNCLVDSTQNRSDAAYWRGGHPVVWYMVTRSGHDSRA